VAELQALNPSLLRMETPPDSTFDLHLPAGTAGIFEQRIAQIPVGHRNSWRLHVVTEGDTLASVAREYHVSAADLGAANELGEGDSLDGMQALAVPARSTPEHSADGEFYRVRRGDTLVTIADRVGVSLSDLRRWNHLRGNVIDAGRRLRVVAPSETYRSSSRKSAAQMRHRTASRAGDPPSRSSSRTASRHSTSSRAHRTAHSAKTVHASAKSTHSSGAKRKTEAKK
jgi:membrane-bound lytic murein transglycosylase D